MRDQKLDLEQKWKPTPAINSPSKNSASSPQQIPLTPPNSSTFPQKIPKHPVACLSYSFPTRFTDSTPACSPGSECTGYSCKCQNPGSEFCRSTCDRVRLTLLGSIIRLFQLQAFLCNVLCGYILDTPPHQPTTTAKNSCPLDSNRPSKL